MASQINQEDTMIQEFDSFLSNLPKQKGLIGQYVYKYQGFWYPPKNLKGIISCNQQFRDPQPSHILLVTYPKSGTTWLKSILFTLLNRDRHPIDQNHPLLTTNSHDLLPFLEGEVRNLDFVPFPSSRTIFTTHMPWVALPDPIKNDSSSKVVYLYRDPKDVFVSLWHFVNKLRPKEMGPISIEEAFELFCSGDVGYGPYWDHVLNYWKQCKENPHKILFFKYEDMKEQPELSVKRLAEFLDCPVSENEEKSGFMVEILKLCSFETLSTLEVNKTGKLASNGFKNDSFFRQGKVGDWNNYMSAEMVQKLDGIIEEKFSGSGFVM